MLSFGTTYLNYFLSSLSQQTADFKVHAGGLESL